MIAYQNIERIIGGINLGYVNNSVGIRSFLNVAANISRLFFQLSEQPPFGCEMKNIGGF